MNKEHVRPEQNRAIRSRASDSSAPARADFSMSSFLRSKTFMLGLLSATALPTAALSGTIAITNAEIHTLGHAGVIAHGSLIIRDHQIDAVGENLPVPKDARVIDAGGKPVTPGLFDPYTSLGLVEPRGSATFLSLEPENG